jgi:NADPH:quinone reductase-like Zn-dependent oxidoreductase
LSASGNKGVTRKYPHTPGIDAAGIVVDSTTKAFGAGEEVIVMGFDLGMNTSGGFGQYISVPSGWAVKLPQGLSQRDSMGYGTGRLDRGAMLVATDGRRVEQRFRRGVGDRRDRWRRQHRSGRYLPSSASMSWPRPAKANED